jgi:hypothetical protein
MSKKILIFIYLVCFSSFIKCVENTEVSSKFLNEKIHTEIEENKNYVFLHNNTNSTNDKFNNSIKPVELSIWDDIAALGLWFLILVIFGPAALIAVFFFICCKNVFFRGNPSPLLG